MRSRRFFLSVSTLLLLTTCLEAQQMGYPSTQYNHVESAFAAQQRELAELQAELAVLRQGQGQMVTATNVGWDQGAVADCPSSHWTVMAEYLILQPLVGEQDRIDRFSSSPGWRATAGWTAASGTGVRARYFQWNKAYPDDGNTGTYDALDVYYIDLEMTREFQLGHATCGVLSAGIRFVEHMEKHRDAPIAGSGNILQSGWGPVLGIEMNRYVTDSLSLFGLARGSIAILNGTDGILETNNHVTTIGELQVGGQWERPFAGGVVFARAALEGQVYGLLSDADNEALGLLGGAFSIGLKR